MLYAVKLIDTPYRGRVPTSEVVAYSADEAMDIARAHLRSEDADRAEIYCKGRPVRTLRRGEPIEPPLPPVVLRHERGDTVEITATADDGFGGWYLRVAHRNAAGNFTSDKTIPCANTAALRVTQARETAVAGTWGYLRDANARVSA